MAERFLRHFLFGGLMQRYRYSYSGADTLAYGYFPGMEHRMVRLESLHTISYSVHERKGPVRSLGFRGIRGLTRAVRTVAGSLIFVVVEDHPLRDMIAMSYESPYEGSTGWSVDKYMVGQGSAFDTLSFSNRLPALMPPFNILMTHMSEAAEFDVTANAQDGSTRFIAQGAATMLCGVEFIDEGVVTSVNDIVSEVTYSFIARDIKPTSMNEFLAGTSPHNPIPKDAAMQTELNELLGLGRPLTMNTYAGMERANDYLVMTDEGLMTEEEERAYLGMSVGEYQAYKEDRLFNEVSERLRR